MMKINRFPIWLKIRLHYSQNTPHNMLKHSGLPMDHFQDSLPRLSVPKLEITIDKYIRSQQAFLVDDAAALDNTTRLAKEFITNEGPALQTQLQAFAKKNKHTSYITDMWFDMYLRDRRPVVLTHQPVMIFKDAEGPKDANQVDIKATNMLYSAIRFIRTYKQGILEPDVYHLDPKTDTASYRKFMSYWPRSVSWYGSYLCYKAFPLDMSQFPNLLFSTRIPQANRDKLVTSPNSKHVVVLHKGHMYTFDLLDAQGDGVSPNQLLSNIRHILAQPANPEVGIGNFTALPRDDWTVLREKLIANPENASSLHQLDSGAFVLCLDDEKISQPGDELLHFLHGPADNRWFDKSFSLIINAHNGRAALTFEHSWGDGVAVLRFFNEVHRDTDHRPVVGGGEPSTNLPTPTVQQLKWNLHGLQEALQQAKSTYDNHRRQLAFHFTQNEKFGRKQAKLSGIGADSAMQLALQMAFYRVHGHFPATYESCSTAAFKHGRTETIRSGTLETNAFTRAALSSSARPSDSDLYALLKKCSDQHSLLTKDAAMGQGWDRHLFALRNMATNASSSSSPLPIFSDKSYQDINHIRLSTSTLSSRSLLLGGFAAVVPDGYGVGYAIQEKENGCGVTSWEGKGTKGQEFCDAFDQSIAEIAKVALSQKTQ